MAYNFYESGYMQITFHGGAGTVTGSKHLVTLDGGQKILLDCGMFQGMGSRTDSLNEDWGFDPATLSCVILSHAHIDHSGLLPKLVKDGFKGKIFATEATRDLTEILLYDSAEIQTYDIEDINKKRATKKLQPFEPLYNASHVVNTMALFETIPYETAFQPVAGCEVMLTNTGHLIGSAAIHMAVTENENLIRLSFSGDIGRYQSVLLKPPAPFPQAHYLVMESTYGNKHHEPSFKNIETLNRWIRHTCLEKKGKLIIPAFSVGRTQEILYALNQLSLEQKLPAIPYFVDSPLSMKATETIKQHSAEFNERLQQVLAVDDDPFMFDGLKYIESVEDSRKLANYTDPCVIISASGTADAGRVRHHIAATIGEEKNTILMVGYCSEESLGGQLLGGSKEVEIFYGPSKVKAEIGKMEGMSAHGDCDELCRFLECQDGERISKIFLVHGEHYAQENLSARLERKGFTRIAIPAQHETFELK